jgi:hypothetical protein
LEDNYFMKGKSLFKIHFGSGFSVVEVSLFRNVFYVCFARYRV